MLYAPTLGELLRAAARTAPDAEALRYRDERLTYGEWDGLADGVAGVLAARGIGHGSVVALLLPSTPLYLVAYLAAARLGAVTTGINVRYRRTEIGHILRCAGAAALVAVDAWHAADFRAVLDTVQSTAPDLRAVVWVAADDLRSSTRATVDGLGGADTTAPPTVVDPDDPATIVFTSGTTGVPKGAWYTHRNLRALAEIDARRYAAHANPFRKHLAAGLSFAHIATMGRLGLQIAHLGTTFIHDAFDPAAVLELIERERLTHVGGIPTQIIMLLDHPDRARRDLSSLRTVVLGGAPSTPELIRRIQRELGVVVSVRYSSTEVGIATASLPEDPPEVLTTTVGKPTPGVELRIVDAANQPQPAGTVGEVVVRSPATMRGYWRAPELTALTIDAAGWVHTGDLGLLDGAGYLHLRGRRSEMYIRGGYNVYPSEVEDRLAQHPKVAHAALIGVPDPVFGEIGWAFVTPRAAVEPPTLAELRAFVGAELASFKRPDGLTIVREVPLTAMFKVDKHALRKLHASAHRALRDGRETMRPPHGERKKSLK